MSIALGVYSVDQLLDALEAQTQAGVAFVWAELAPGRVGKALRWWGPDPDACIGLATQAASLISRDNEPAWDEESEEGGDEALENPVEELIPRLGQYL